MKCDTFGGKETMQNINLFKNVNFSAFLKLFFLIYYSSLLLLFLKLKIILEKYIEKYIILDKKTRKNMNFKNELNQIKLTGTD